MLAVQQNPASLEKLFLQTCDLDRAAAKKLGARFMVRWEIEPGSAAKRDSYRMTTRLAGYDAKGKNFKGDKLTRARALAVQAEAGNVADPAKDPGIRNSYRTCTGSPIFPTMTSWTPRPDRLTAPSATLRNSPACFDCCQSAKYCWRFQKR
jgi:hypothetical protein